MFDVVPGLLEWFESSHLMGGSTDLQSIPGGLVGWFEDGAVELIDALRSADSADAVWSWSQDNSVWHYVRMMPIETSIHRWDAQMAHGRPDPIPDNLAVEA